jgi:hypothetical protein
MLVFSTIGFAGAEIALDTADECFRLSMANSNLTRLPVFGTTLDNAAAMYNG